MDEKSMLERCTNSNTNCIDLRGVQCDAKVVDVHDGDTVKLVIFYRGAPTKFTCRMMGYDSPELKQKENADTWRSVNDVLRAVTNVSVSDESHSKMQLKALMDMNTKLVRAQFHGKDKYGRELVELFDHGVSINTLLMEKHYNIAYNGRGRRPVHT